MQKLNSIAEISDYLKQTGNKLEPVSPLEISLLEKKLKIIFPGVYKVFLQLMGKGAGIFMKGSSVFYDELFMLKQWADELVLENNIAPIPDNAFVFWMHQGYQIAYFKLDEGDNPPVYYFSEGSEIEGFEMKEKSLVAFFVSQLLL